MEDLVEIGDKKRKNDHFLKFELNEKKKCNSEYLKPISSNIFQGKKVELLTLNHNLRKPLDLIDKDGVLQGLHEKIK